MAIICLRTCNDIFEANIIKTRLIDGGVSCFLTNENFTNLYPGFNGMMGAGVQIMIDEQDMEKAIEILEPQAKNLVQCPHCQSQEVALGLGSNRFRKFIIIALSLISWIPFNNIKLTYHCKNCSTEFRM